MEDDKLQEIQSNMERMNESIATLKLTQDKEDLVLYGDKDIRLLGILERVENVENALKNINGMPQQVKELKEEIGEVKGDVSTLVNTDQKRVWMLRGLVAGITLQSGGLIAVLAKMFS